MRVMYWKTELELIWDNTNISVTVINQSATAWAQTNAFSFQLSDLVANNTHISLLIYDFLFICLFLCFTPPYPFFFIKSSPTNEYFLNIVMSNITWVVVWCGCTLALIGGVKIYSHISMLWVWYCIYRLQQFDEIIVYFRDAIIQLAYGSLHTLVFLHGVRFG